MGSKEVTARPQRALPMVVLVLAVVGGVAGALLAEPGNFVGNTIPSTLTFAVAGLLVGGVIEFARRRIGVRGDRR